MPRVGIRPAPSHRKTLGLEIAHLRGLEIDELRARWRTVFRRKAPPHLPRHLLFRVLAYRLQADALGDLDGAIQRILDTSTSPVEAAKRAIDRDRSKIDLAPGTLLTREWKGQAHRIAVTPTGFAWNNKTYPSLSKLVLAITGTRWNGPRFFGLRDRPPTSSPTRG